MSELAKITPRSVYENYLLSKPPKVINAISPSQLGGCHRAHYYKIKHVEALIKPGVAQLANFELGFVWEGIIERGLIDQKVPFEVQTEFDDIELNMHGTSDFIIGDKKTEAIMWDSKTQRSEWFWYREGKRKRGQYDWWEENYQYIIQQGCYLLMAERRGYNITKSVLAFVSKDDGFIGEELDVVLTPKLRREIQSRIDDLNYYLEKDEVPPCTCEGWKVGYCDYGNPNTMEPNRKKKMVSTECCGDLKEIEAWRAEAAKKEGKKVKPAIA